MHPLSFLNRAGAAVVLSATMPCAPGQSSGATPSPNARPDGETVQLNAFTVSATDATGYRAEKSTAGTIISTAIVRLPLSLQVVTAQLIADTDSRRVEDAIRYTSGVGLAARNEGGNGSTSSENFVIRGFQSGSVLRNGLRAQGITDASNLERVEILKGPSSIFFGAADPGGIVNYVTKQPLAQRFGSARISLGRFNERYAEFDYNTPLHGNSLLLRVAGSWLDADGWRRFWKNRQTFFYATLAWTPTPTTRLAYDFQFRRQTGLRERNGDVWLTTDNLPAPFTQRFMPPAVDAIARGFGTLMPTDTYWELATGDVVRLTQKLGDATVLQANVSAGDSNRKQRTTTSLNRPTTANNYRYTDRPGYLEEGAIDRTININIVHQRSILNTRHKFLLGWDRKEQKNKAIYIAYTANSPYSITRSLLAPMSFEERYAILRYPTLAEIGQPGVGYVQNVPWEKPIPDQGFYLTDQVTALDDKLTAIAGVRYSYLGAQKINSTTPQIGANYALTKHLTLYALYSKSFRPNGRSNSLVPTSPYLPPEQGVGYEGGAKINLRDGTITGTFAYFDVEKTNVQTNNSAAAVAGFNGVGLAGAQRSKGAEVDLVFTPLKNLSAILAYAYTDARVTKDIINPGTPDLNGDGIADNVNFQRLRQVSPRTGSLWIKYGFTAGPLKDLSLGAGYQYRAGPIPLDASYARLFLTQGSYARLDAMASYRTRVFGRLTRLQVNLNNLTDKFYIDKAFGYAEPFTWRFSTAIDF